MAPAELPQIVDLHGAAAILGISYWSVRELIAAGELPIVRPPAPLNPKRALRRVLLDRRDLLAAVDRWKSGGGR